MATVWGSTEGHLRVGIDCWTSTPSAGSTTVTVYLRVYAQAMDSWYFDDSESWSCSGYGGGGGSWHNNLSSGQIKTLWANQWTAGIDYDGGPTYTWTAGVSNMYNGGTPSVTRSLTLPARPPSAPNAIAAPTCTETFTDMARFVWANPGENGSPLDQYQGQIARDSSFTNIVRSWTSPWATGGLVGDLPPGTQLYCRLRAHNAVGWGPWGGARVFATLVDQPGAPTGLSVSDVRPTSATLSWYAPSYTGGGSITTYEIQRSTSASFSSPTTTSDPSSPTTLSSLLPGTTYYVRVRALNSAGSGPWSSTASFTTLSSLRVGDGDEWLDCLVWVGNGSQWVLSQVRRGTGTGWE